MSNATGFCRHLVCIGLTLVLALPNSVFAAGLTLHIYMSEKAVSRLKNANLKKLLNSEKRAYRNGSFYPDSGYVHREIAKHLPGQKGVAPEYGEVSHWSEFLNAFMSHLQATCSMPFNASCRQKLAFFFGSLAHTVEDVNFDRYFVREVANQTFGGDLGKAQNWTDMALDFVATIELKRLAVRLSFNVPASDLAVVYRNINQSVSERLIQDGMRKMKLLGIAERATAPFAFPYLGRFFGLNTQWGHLNYMTARGGVYDTANVVAGVWDKAWAIIEDSGFTKRPVFHNTGSWPDVDFWVSE